MQIILLSNENENPAQIIYDGNAGIISEKELQLIKRIKKEINFVCKRVEANLSHMDLTNFYENLENLNIEVLRGFHNDNDELLSNAGEYDIEGNIITIQEDMIEKALAHEMFHMLSSCFDENEDDFVNGFVRNFELKMFDNNDEDIEPYDIEIGRALTEGYTDLLAERYCDHNVVYFFESRLAFLLELVIGKEKMEYLYSKADFDGLVDTLVSLSENEAEIIKFLINTDLLLKDGKFTRKEYDRLRRAGAQLLEWYMKSEEQLLEEKQITNSEFINDVAEYALMLEENDFISNRSYSHIVGKTSESKMIKDKKALVKYQLGYHREMPSKIWQLRMSSKCKCKKTSKK